MSHSDRIPAQPFVDWLQARLAATPEDEQVGALQALADKLGTTTRALYRYIRSLDSESQPTDTFPAKIVEDMLDRAEVRMWEVPGYEHLADDDEPQRAEAYCAGCRDMVTPDDDGICPWCEKQTSSDTPRKAYCATCDQPMYAANDGNCWRCGSHFSPVPWISCGCGCGAEFSRFGANFREVRFVRGHAPRTLERTAIVDAGPFRDWLVAELASLDPVLALSRQVGLPRTAVLDILNERTTSIDAGDVRRCLWTASRQGQGKGMPPRPGSPGLGDLYPDVVRSKTCPACGGGKSAHADMCKTCRRQAGLKKPRVKYAGVNPDVLAAAKRLTDQGLSMRAAARQLLPRTRYASAESFGHQLRREYRERGWDTATASRSSTTRLAA